MEPINVDCWNLSYEDGSIDCMVLDPPYMEGFYRRLETQMAGSGTYTTFRATYSASRPNVEGPKYHDAVIDLYFKAGKESYRVLCRHGILIVKCQDEVSANIQHLTQEQARKNHSCFPVFVRKDGESPRRKW